MSTVSKKRKPAAPDRGVQPKKKVKTAADVKEKRKSKDKGKARETDVETEFQVVQASLVISIPPIFATNPHAGVQEMLDSMVMRYIPALRGVVLAHSNLSFLKQTAAITADCPFLVCNIGPYVQMKLVGKVNLCSPDHISLLLHRTFNVSIPRHHIPTDDWEFEYGAVQVDPVDGSASPENDGDDATDEKAGGRWVHRLTGERLGGKDGYLEFTVIGLTVSNEMLSLVGSIQHDPFSPEHIAVSLAKPKGPKTTASIEEVAGSGGEEGDDVAMPERVEGNTETKKRRGNPGKPKNLS
ncbi:hypothetical protein B0H10DRAFT_2166227 [Mycena sp. CBHHK59/15]|nr:hypothetical protein B0H10DRAFT_2166227 [Mycena sp. CBHHK59/15]